MEGIWRPQFVRAWKKIKKNNSDITNLSPPEYKNNLDHYNLPPPWNYVEYNITIFISSSNILARKIFGWLEKSSSLGKK